MLAGDEAGGTCAGAAFVFCVALAFSAPCAGCVAGDATGEAAGDAPGEGVACCCGSSEVVCTTERWPVSEGRESAIATSMKSAAAPIVTFARMVCVPRGPNAVLETLLEKSAPASALPGCKSTATISTTHERINRMYKNVVN